MDRLSLLIILISLVSCTHTLEINDNVFPVTEAPENVTDEYQVSLKDIDSYVKFKVLDAKHKGQELSVQDISPVLSENGDASMYIINYNEGWDVISADKRSPMVLATSESGSFTRKSGDPHDLYFAQLEDDLALFRKASDIRLIETRSMDESEQENVEFWDAITASSNFVESRMIDPDTPLDTIEVDLIVDGHWELMGVKSEVLVDQIVDHLISTEWGQGSPYNAFCPLKSNGDNGRAPAGCVAVSGAQTLVFLQDKFNLNISAPSSVSITGNVDNYSRCFSNPGTTLWDSVKTDDYSAALLISYIGHLVEMEYGNTGSEASTEDLKYDVFQQCGISCQYGSYDSNKVKSNLLNGLPVIVSAYTGVFGDGHSFIIDGFKSFKTKYTYTYEWVYDTYPDNPVEYVRPRTEITYSSPYIEQVKMNWGWANGLSNNDTWYTPVENWTVTSDQYGGQMIFNISLKI